MLSEPRTRRMSSTIAQGGQPLAGQPALPNALASARRRGYVSMHRTYLLLATALVEVVTGLLLLVWPAVPIALLLGVDQASSEALIAARIAGAALLAIGVACWLGRNDHSRPAQK